MARLPPDNPPPHLLPQMLSYLDEGEPNAAECCVHKYLVRVFVVLLHERFSVVGPIPFLLAAIFFPGHPYIRSTTVLPDMYHVEEAVLW